MEIEFVLGIIKISFIFLNLILHSISDQYFENQDQAPESKSSHFSNLLWSWMDGIIYKGYKRPLVQSDVPKHPHYLNVSKVLQIYFICSGGTGSRIPVFGYLESAEKWVEGKSKKAFLHFLPPFWHI